MKKNINEMLQELKKQMNDNAVEFAFDYDITSHQYIDDAISDFADSYTSIYYYDIIEFIKNNVEKVNDAINEFGWDGVGQDLYKAGQTAEFLSIEEEVNEDLEEVKQYLILKYLNDFMEEIEEDTINEIFDDIDDVEYLDDLLDLVNDKLEDLQK